MSIMF